jgi:tetratricopeptide (TPR) repeat protein
MHSYQYQLSAALQKYQERDLAAAEQHLLSLLRTRPNSQSALHLLACIYSESGKLDVAIRLFQRLVTLDSTDYATRYNLAKAYMAASMYRKAASELLNIPILHRNSVDSWVTLGLAYCGSGLYDSASDALEKALNLAPEKLEPIAQLISNISESISPVRMQNILSRYKTLAPQSRLDLAHLLVDSNKAELAIIIFETFVNGDSLPASSYYYYGLALFCIGDIDSAIVYAQRSTKAFPSHYDSYCLLAKLSSEKSDYKQAVSALLAYTKIDPQCTEAYISLGEFYALSGESSQSLKSYLKALETSSDDPDLYHRVASILDEKKFTTESVTTYSQYYQMRPIRKSVTLQCVAQDASSSFLSQPLTSYPSIPANAKFIPSYIDSRIPFGTHLLFSHIPKTAGLRFSTPILACISNYFSDQSLALYSDLLATIYPKARISYLLSDRIDSSAKYSAMLNSIAQAGQEPLDFSFFVPHGVPSTNITNIMSKRYGIKPITMAIWRDPRDRLLSALKYLWRSSNQDPKSLEARIRRQDSFLDNALYTACYGTSNINTATHKHKTSYIDHLIDIKTFDVVDAIATFYLSSCRLPNLIISSMINAAPEASECTPSLIYELYDRCIEKGFIEKDLLLESSGIIKNQLPHEFRVPVNLSSVDIHPLTVIIRTDTTTHTSGSGWLLPTDQLVGDSGYTLLSQIFS